MNPDAILLRLAETHARLWPQGDRRTRACCRLLRGRVERIIRQSYAVPENRNAIWSEWNHLAYPSLSPAAAVAAADARPGTPTHQQKGHHAVNRGPTAPT